MKDNLLSLSEEYQNLTYNDLSSEFQKAYPSVVRASQLIALMYNRLTLVENFSHKDAKAKIHNDHKHLAGFSNRNIRRSLPLDNLNVPRRVRPQRPKNSLTGANDANLASKLSGQSVECSSCIELSLENHELKEALEKSSKLITSDNVAHAASPSINEIHNVLEFEFYLQKQEILDYLGEPYLSIKDGDLKVWFSGKIDRKSGYVTAAKPGRIIQQQIEGDNRDE